VSTSTRAPGVWRRAGTLSAALRPDLGGCIAGLWAGEQPLLRSTLPEALTSPRQCACFPLLPYSNRVGHCRFEWQGHTYSTQRNFVDHPHSLHGVGWLRPWELEQADDSRATLVLRHSPDEDWPFAFEARQQIELKPGGLRLTLQLINTDTRCQPVGLGWHPYFPSHPETRLQLPITQRWEPGPDALPTHAGPHAALDADVASLRLDHCFGGWTGEASIDTLPQPLHLQASTPAETGFFCVEPVSHVNNAVQSPDPVAEGLVALEPGDSLSAWMTLSLKP
jgi:aldose 1-epimerase